MKLRHLATVLGASILFAPLGCKSKDNAVKPAAPPQVSAAPPAPAPAAPTAEPGEPDAENATLAETAADPHKHMKAHFVRALRLEDAVLAGNLVRAKSEARWLAVHDDENVPVSWVPHLKPFQDAAKAIVDATSLDAAAVSAAQVAASCGSCHEATGAKPKIGSSPVVKRASSVKEHMAGQINALDKLWNGLVVPSDAAWKDGADVLAHVVVTEKALEKIGLAKVESAKLLAITLQQLSETAKKAPKAERAAVYADLLTTCVACHTTLSVHGAGAAQAGVPK